VLTSLQALLRLATLRWLGVFVCALAVLLATPSTASALEPAQTKTRVWGFDFAAHNSVGLFRAASLGKHQGICSARAEAASGSLLAAKAGVRQIDDAASAATTVGRRGQQANFPNPNAPIPRNAPGTVGGREFSGHAFDRMQERGFVPSVVENAIQHGAATPGSAAGTLRHFDPVNKFNVITDAATGRVITVF